MKNHLLIALTLCYSAQCYADPNHVVDQFQHQGIEVNFAVAPISPTNQPTTQATHQTTAQATTQPLVTGDDVFFQFDIHDTVSGHPIVGAFPAAWIHPRVEDNTPRVCQKKAEIFIGGSLLSKAAIDLNSYYVVTLNDDASLSIVDPLFGFGGSKLLTMLPLPSTGFDWAKTNDNSTVWISLPQTNQIARLNTANWQIATSKGDWSVPEKVALTPDQRQLWVGVEQGVVIFDTAAQPDPTLLQQRQKIPLDSAVLDILYSVNQQFAFVQTRQALLIIDTKTLAVSQTIATPGATAVAYSGLADTLYVSQSSGRIVLVDVKQQQITTELNSEPGRLQLKFTPDGRWGLLINTDTDRLSIIDPAKQKIVQTGLIEDQPDQLAFSDNLAYIRHKGSSTLLMITLDDPNIGVEGKPIPVVDTPAGDQPPSAGAAPTGAIGIIQAPGANAIMIANYPDKSIYFYKEGMAAPMGHFGNYGRSPKALLSIDRSLRQSGQPGVYQSIAKLPDPGVYDVVYFMDSPRIVHCFTLTVAKDPATIDPVEDPKPQLFISQLTPAPSLIVGQAATLVFQRNMAVNSPVQVLIRSTSGLWRKRLTVHDPATTFELSFIPPLVGDYQVSMTVDNAPFQWRYSAHSVENM